MSEVQYLLAVDIGNSRIHVGMVDLVTTTCVAAEAFELSGGFGELKRRVCAMNRGTIPHRAVVSGVVRQVVETVCAGLEEAGCTAMLFSSTGPLPFSIHYQHPETLGADRCANALYASQRYPGSNVILISAGTALVIDFFSGTTFCGGAVMPGVTLQSKVLATYTDALPAVELSAETLPALPGTSTSETIAAGILYGISGAVERIVSHYLHRVHGMAVPLLATGGEWHHIAPLVGLDIVYVPDMTLVGTALYAMLIK